MKNQERIIPSETLIRHILNKANPKYQLIILLMTDAGLRVTEVVRLQLRHFNFPERTVRIETEAASQNRTIPLTDRLFQALVTYWSHLPNRDDLNFVFPPSEQSDQPHLSRKMVYRRIVAYSDGLLTPKQLRQYFAHKLQLNNCDFTTKQELLGTKNLQTGDQNNPISAVSAKQAIQDTENQPKFFKKLFGAFTRKQPVEMIPMEIGLTRFHIGRKAEIAQITDLSQKQVNILILGVMGIGKSHLLDNYKTGKILRVDDFRYPKTVLGGIILELFNNDKEAIMEKLLEVKGQAAVEKIATKESTKRLCELAIDATHPKEYTLIIDDLTDITKIGVRMLEKLKNHFHIIAAARQLKVEHATCISNFEKLELKPLNRAETFEFIDQISTPLQSKIEDLEAYKNRIWEATNGVPLFIIEMVERLSKEPVIDATALSSIKHTASRAEIDFSVPLIIAFSSLLVLRYLGSELGHNAGAFRLLGGIALVIAFFSRRIFRALRRRYV